MPNIIIIPYTSPALPSNWYIYWTRDQVVGNGFCSSVVEHWSSNPEDAGSDSQPEGLGVAFFATGPGLGLIMYILTTLEFPKHNHGFHIIKIAMFRERLLLMGWLGVSGRMWMIFRRKLNYIYTPLLSDCWNCNPSSLKLCIIMYLLLFLLSLIWVAYVLSRDYLSYINSIGSLFIFCFSLTKSQCSKR